MKKILKTLFVLFISILVLGCENDNTSNVGTMESISSNEVKEIMDNNDKSYILIDVREDYEFKEGHIPGAINIPLGNITTIDYSLDKTIIVYCKSGNRSNQAAIKLKNMGYNVKDMGGIVNWTYEIE